MVDEKYPPYDFTDLLLISNGLFLQFINQIDKKEGLEPFCSTEKDEASLKKYLEFQGELTREEKIEIRESASGRAKGSLFLKELLPKKKVL